MDKYIPEPFQSLHIKSFLLPYKKYIRDSGIFVTFSANSSSKSYYGYDLFSKSKKAYEIFKSEFNFDDSYLNSKGVGNLRFYFIGGFLKTRTFDLPECGCEGEKCMQYYSAAGERVLADLVQEIDKCKKSQTHPLHKKGKKMKSKKLRINPGPSSMKNAARMQEMRENDDTMLNEGEGTENDGMDTGYSYEIENQEMEEEGPNIVDIQSSANNEDSEVPNQSSSSVTVGQSNQASESSCNERSSLSSQHQIQSISSGSEAGLSTFSSSALQRQSSNATSSRQQTLMGQTFQDASDDRIVPSTLTFYRSSLRSRNDAFSDVVSSPAHAQVPHATARFTFGESTSSSTAITPPQSRSLGEGMDDTRIDLSEDQVATTGGHTVPNIPQQQFSIFENDEEMEFVLSSMSNASVRRKDTMTQKPPQEEKVKEEEKEVIDIANLDFIYLPKEENEDEEFYACNLELGEPPVNFIHCILQINQLHCSSEIIEIDNHDPHHKTLAYPDRFSSLLAILLSANQPPKICLVAALPWQKARFEPDAFQIRMYDIMLKLRQANNLLPQGQRMRIYPTVGDSGSELCYQNMIARRCYAFCHLLSNLVRFLSPREDKEVSYSFGGNDVDVNMLYNFTRHNFTRVNVLMTKVFESYKCRSPANDNFAKLKNLKESELLEILRALDFQQLHQQQQQHHAELFFHFTVLRHLCRIAKSIDSLMNEDIVNQFTQALPYLLLRFPEAHKNNTCHQLRVTIATMNAMYGQYQQIYFPAACISLSNHYALQLYCQSVSGGKAPTAEVLQNTLTTPVEFNCLSSVFENARPFIYEILPEQLRNLNDMPINNFDLPFPSPMPVPQQPRIFKAQQLMMSIQQGLDVPQIIADANIDELSLAFEVLNLVTTSQDYVTLPLTDDQFQLLKALEKQ